jgi:hypothetical protein
MQNVQTGIRIQVPMQFNRRGGRKLIMLPPDAKHQSPKRIIGRHFTSAETMRLWAISLKNMGLTNPMPPVCCGLTFWRRIFARQYWTDCSQKG